MKEAVFRITIAIVSIYVIGLIFASFTQFVMQKKVLDINNTHTILDITMPHGKHFDPRLYINTQNELEGNISIKENEKVIYFKRINKKYTNPHSLVTFYALISDEKNMVLF